MESFCAFDPTANSFDFETEPRRRKRDHHGPSKGCECCRRRKIKCDENHPTCSRCQIAGLTCVYRDYHRLIFRDETTRTASRARRCVRTKQGDREDLAPTLNCGRPKQLLPSVEQLATTRFFYDFLLDTTPDSGQSSQGGGYFARISDVSHACKPRPCSSLALSAAANANFWRRHGSSRAQINSLRDGGKALQRLRKDLEDSGKCHVTADVLAASFLLAIYALLTSRNLRERASWTMHVNGAFALLNSEDKNRNNNPEMRGLTGVLQTVVFQFLVDCLLMGRHPRLLYVSTIARDDPRAALLGFMYRTAELCALWKDNYPADSTDLAQQKAMVDDFLGKCHALDGELEAWMQDRLEFSTVAILENVKSNVPPPLRPFFTSRGAPTTLHLYADIDQAHRWQFYRACRLTLLRTMLAAIDAALTLNLPDATFPKYERSRTWLCSCATEIVDDLLSTVFSTFRISDTGKAEPESMADVKGFRGSQLLWPLHTAGSCLISMSRHCSDAHVKLDWVRGLFRCIRDDLGIQIANVFLQRSDIKE